MTTVILVRHGQTEWNRSERFRGHADVPLDHCQNLCASNTESNSLFCLSSIHSIQQIASSRLRCKSIQCQSLSNQFSFSGT